MSQTAENILAENQYLQIAGKEIQTSAHELFQVLENELDKPLIENLLFEKTTSLYYRTRVRLSFSLSREFQKHFATIRGLIEFNRSKDFTFHYDRQSKTFEADIALSEINGLQRFFDKVANWLTEEIRFKEALKSVIEFEHRYKLEKASVYSLLKNTTSLTTTG